MSRGNGRKRTKERLVVHCAVYARVSTPDQANGDFTSIDNQREACEAYVASQKHEGWICLPDHYDDVGFSGGTLERPELSHLLSDIGSGRIQAVVVYKLDRLSRSLLDFSRLVEVFDRHGVSLVSVTQPINTADSTGRLMLNILLSFAQYEREMIADRTRDKVSAARRKGKWTGGMPVLGFDTHPDGGKLVINEEEATMVREIFQLYLKLQSLVDVAEKLNRRGWKMKSWTTKQGNLHGGGAFTKANLYRMLTSKVFVGKVEHRGQVYNGEHKAIISKKTFDQVQALLGRNGKSGGARVKNRHGVLLKGLLRCAACDAAMTPNNTRKGNKLYRYYVCTHAQQRGYKTCPTRSISAPKIERFVVDQIRIIGQDPALIKETAKQVIEAMKAKRPPLIAEQKRLKRELTKKRQETRRLLDALASGKVKGAAITEKLGELEEDSVKLGKRITEIQEELVIIEQETFNQDDLTQALSLFHPIWDVLYPIEQARVIQLLIEQIDYHGGTDTLGITFRATGIRALASEIDEAKEVTV